MVELPDNLKALFRPVAMVVPDLEKIAENMLFSNGFIDSKILASKLVNLYLMCKKVSYVRVLRLCNKLSRT